MSSHGNHPGAYWRKRLTRRGLLGATLAAGAAALAACGGGGQKQSSSNASPAASAGNANAPARWGMNVQQAADWQTLENAAKKEGSVTVYALTTIPPDSMNTFLDLWKQDYPTIKVEMTTGQPADVTARVSTEQQAKAYTGDTAEIGATSARQLNQIGAVTAFVPPASQDPSFKWHVNPLFDEEHKGTNLTTRVGYVPFWVNTNVVKAGEEPKIRQDLTDPKWKGKIAWIVPWAAGYGWYEYYFSKKTYGADWPDKMSRQSVTFLTDANAAVGQLARGEFGILLADGGGQTAERLIEQNQPIKAVWPDDFTYGTSGGFILLKGAPHPNTAKVFINWWFTERGQKFLADLGQFANREDIQPKYDWMKGNTHPKEYYVFSKASDDALAEPNQQEAAKLFRK